MRDKTREAMRLFLGGRCYTAEKLEKDYLAEVANYSNDRWEAPQRAARLAASVKRYKTSEMLRFIFATIAYDPDPDLTPLTVRRLFCARHCSEDPEASGWLLKFLGRRGVSTAARTAIRRWWKKWLPDIVMPPNYTGLQRWQKLNG